VSWKPICETIKELTLSQVRAVCSSITVSDQRHMASRGKEEVTHLAP
jgi:hypothetical protein